MNELPTPQQQKYLGRLLAKAHEYGVPYLPTDALSRKQASDWIDYLKRVVGEEEPSGSSSPRPSRVHPILVASAVAKPPGR